jgi:CBS domain-containing protein
MKIGDIVTRTPACITGSATQTEAAMEMKILDVGILLVYENGQLAGIVTDRDIAIRGIANEIDPKTTPVRDIMTRDMIWCFEDQEVAEAARLMEEHQIRRLPVLDRRKRLVGIVSLSDIALRAGGENVVDEALQQLSGPPVFA